MSQVVEETRLDATMTPPAEGRPGRVGQVTVLVHTRNERDHIADLVTRVEALSGAAAGEVVFVDDSDDDTPAEILRVAARVVIPVHLVHRSRGERSGGLAGAVRAGMRVARCRHVCVLDGAHLQPEEIPELVAAAAFTSADLVTGSTNRLFLLRRGSADLEGVRARRGRLVKEIMRRSPELRVTDAPPAASRRPARIEPWRAAAPRPVG